MQVQVHTDNHITGSEKLTSHVESVVQATLGRFATRITRVEVHLTEESSGPNKAHDNDKRCVMEARLGGLQPVAVTHHASNLDQAIDGAAEKLEHLLERTLGRLES
jgi:ribosomal subunit interface protein